MTSYEKDCCRTVAKWLNEECGPVPRQEIATILTAFQVADSFRPLEIKLTADDQETLKELTSYGGGA